MKKFAFPLHRVLDWRDTLAQVEEAKLERMYGELRALESSEAALRAERERSERAVAQAPSAEGFELAALDAFRRFAVAEHTRLEERRADCAKRIAAQIQVVAQKRCDVRLLQHLKDKRWAAWNRGVAREIETQAGETYLAKWQRGAL